MRTEGVEGEGGVGGGGVGVECVCVGGGGALVWRRECGVGGGWWIWSGGWVDSI